MTNDNPQLISRKRHYFYVLVFSVAAWLFVAALLGGLVPIKYLNSGQCACAVHDGFTNVSYLVYGIGGVIAGFVFSFPFNRWMLVAYSKPESKSVKFSWMSRIGRRILGWRGLIFLIIIPSVYLVGEKLTFSFFVEHPTEMHRRIYGVHKLHCMTAMGKINEVKKLLEEGVDINIKTDPHGWTPLHFCAWNRNYNIAKLLIEKGADVNAEDGSGSLVVRIANGQTSEYITPGRTPLHIALMNDAVNIMALLIQSGADVNATHGQGYTLLHIAARHQNKAKYAAAKLLIENGANLNALDNHIQEQTPLHVAVENGNMEIVRLLIQSGADMNIKQDFNKDTPLILALRHRKDEIAETLIQHGADVNKANRIGTTPLINVSGRCNMKLVKLLLEKGADINAIGGFGNDSALHRAASERHTEVVRLLIENGANVNARSELERTPLHEAARNPDKELCELLVANGADINAIAHSEWNTYVKSDKPHTPLDYALACNRKENAELLRSHGAKTGEELRKETGE